MTCQMKDRQLPQAKGNHIQVTASKVVSEGIQIKMQSRFKGISEFEKIQTPSNTTVFIRADKLQLSSPSPGNSISSSDNRFVDGENKKSALRCNPVKIVSPITPSSRLFYFS